MNTSSYKENKKCRVCGGLHLTEYIDLGMMPLSNELLDSPIIQSERFPLKVLFCNNCFLSQLSIVVDPQRLFGNYVYRSSISSTYKDHCRKMAKELKAKMNLNDKSFHIDIAGNDCALLKEFRDEIGLRILNVDPATNLCEICEKGGIPALNEFWSWKIAWEVGLSHGSADLITATNVFAHVDDVKEFISACRVVLKQTGVLIMEFPYIIDFIEKNEFDTIYFEHLSYFSIYPLKKLCEEQGLVLMDVERQDIHGGSVRVTIGYGKQESSVEEFILKEKQEGYHSIEKYNKWAQKVRETIKSLREGIYNIISEDRFIAAFAASAKGNVLLNSAGITDKEIRFIVDQTPEKIDKYSPGTNIVIRDMEHLIKFQPRHLIILSWNFADEIIKKTKEAGYKGKYIIPIPEFKVL